MSKTALKFGEFVKYKRKKMGLTQKQLALKALGADHHPYISNLENGRTKNITTDNMDRLLVALDGYADFFEIPPNNFNS